MFAKNQLVKLGGLVIFLAVIGGLFAGVHAEGQEDPLQSSGLVPVATFEHSEIDSINMQNGFVIFHIPLYALPQKGRLSLTFSVTGSKSAFSVTKDPDCTQQTAKCYIVGGGRGHALGFTWDQPLFPQFTSNRYPPNSNTFFNVFSVVDATGASHLLGYDASNPSVLRATDGTGLVYVPNNTTPYSPFIGDLSGTIYEADGVRQIWIPDSFGNLTQLKIQDPDGNSISFNNPSFPGQVTDSLARVIPAGPPATTSSTTGCPAINASYQPTTSSTTWTVPGPSGGQESFLFCYATITIHTSFWPNYPLGCSSPCKELTATTGVLQSVVLPNNTFWAFIYDAANPSDSTSIGYGQVTQVILPTGGTISYQYTNYYQNAFQTLPSLGRSVTQRTADPGNGGPVEKWTYSRPFSTSMPLTTTVTDPSLNDTVYTFNSVSNGSNVFETKRQIYTGPQASGTLLRTVTTAYQAATGNPQSGIFSGGQPGTSLAVLPNSVTTTIDNGLSTTTTSQYNDGGFVDVQPKCTGGANNQFSCDFSSTTQVAFGRVTSTSTTDYDGSTLRTVQTQYQYQQNPKYFSANFMNLVSSATTFDGAGVQAAQATYGYDENNGSPQGVLGHQTSVSRWLNGGNPVVAETVYNTQGMPIQKIDANGNATTTTYDATGIFPSQIQYPDTSGIHHIEKFQYDAVVAKAISHTDQNGQTTTAQYDNMGRIKQVEHPAQVVKGTAMNGSTTYTYNDTVGSLSLQRTRQQDGSNAVTDITYVDGLGRAVETQLKDPEGDVFTITTYDSMGRVSTVTNPYRTTSDPTYGVTTTTYDALGRIIGITHPDNSATTVTFTGRATQVQDPGNGNTRVMRITQNDALGRLRSVCEVTGAKQASGNSPAGCNQDIAATGFLTSYQYDSLGNLKGVQQGANLSAIPPGLSRSFQYDTLSRLTSATNPESGTTTYQYDANGNVTKRLRPAPNQTNQNTTVTTTYGYDQLNRLASITYSDGVTPSVVKNYDTTSELGLGLNNTIGRLSAEYVKNPSGQVLSGIVYSYDPMGRIVDNSQCVQGACNSTPPSPSSITYSYDLLGNELTATNGQGVTFGYSYDSAGRMRGMTSSLSDASHPGQLLSGMAYNALGSLTAASLGSALNEVMHYDCHGWGLSYASAVYPAVPGGTVANTPGCQNSTAMNIPQMRPGMVLQTGKDTPWYWRNVGLGRTSEERSVAFIVITRAVKKKKDHGLLKVEVKSLDGVYREQTVAVEYGRKDTALEVGQRLAATFQARGSLVHGRVKSTGESAVVELTRTDQGGVGSFVFASVKSNRRHASLTAIVSLKTEGPRLVLSAKATKEVRR